MDASKENKHVWCETIVWQEPLINLLWASSATVPSLHAQSHSVLHSLTFCYHSLSFLQTSSKLTKLTIQMICNWFPAFAWNCALFVNAQVHDAVGNAKGSFHMINYKVFFFFGYCEWDWHWQLVIPAQTLLCRSCLFSMWSAGIHIKYLERLLERKVFISLADSVCFIFIVIVTLAAI